MLLINYQVLTHQGSADLYQQSDLTLGKTTVMQLHDPHESLNVTFDGRNGKNRNRFG